MNRTAIVVLALLTAAPCAAQEIEVPSARFERPENVAAGETYRPAGWSGEVTAHQSSGLVVLEAGSSITCEIAVPKLSERESKCPAWRLVFIVDRGPDDHGRLEFGLAGVAQRASRESRQFLVLDVESSMQSFGRSAAVELRAPAGACAIDDARLFRVPVEPSRKLLGKANGPLGPDALAAAAFGFDALMVHGQPILPIMAVRADSPAARARLVPGDWIVAINDAWLPDGDVAPGWNWLRNSHESLLGSEALGAVTRGLPARERSVELTVLHDGVLESRRMRLNRRERFTRGDDFWASPGMSALRADALARVIATQQNDGSWKANPVHTALGGLALLSTGDAAHAPRVRAAADWLLAHIAEPATAWYWHGTYAGLFLCEYVLATGDDRALDAIEQQLAHIASAMHTSKWGTPTLGHGPKGLPYGNKSLVALTTHILVFEALAERCGIESDLWNTLEPYMMSAWSDPQVDDGHGGLGYNASHKDQAEFWSRTGLFALSLRLRDEKHEVQRGLVEMMRRRHPWIRNSHAYGEPGGAWGLIALSHVDGEVFREVMDAYRWWIALAWEPGYGLKYTTPHMGAPYMEGDVLMNNAYSIVLGARERGLHITGSTRRDWLDVEGFETALTDVLIGRTHDGAVSLACRVPGPVILYTVDGSMPTRRSRVYTEPFVVESGTTVRARAWAGPRALDSELPGPVFERSIGFATRGRVVAASGHQDATRAVQKAEHVLDGNEALYWVPDNGLNASGFPHWVEIEYDESRRIGGLRIRFASEDTAARDVTVQSNGAQIHGVTLERFERDVVLRFEPHEFRLMRVTFQAPFKDGSTAFMVGEIEALPEARSD